MEEQDLRYIRYTFREDYLRAVWDPHYKIEWTAYPDGKIIKRVFKLVPGIDEQTFMSNPDARIDRDRCTLEEKETFSVEPADIQKLFNSIQADMRTLCSMCDASDSARIVLEGGGRIEFNPAPFCLHKFFFNLDHKD